MLMLSRLATGGGARRCLGWTVRETVTRLAGELEAADVPEPETSASHLVAHLLNESNVEKLSTDLASQGGHSESTSFAFRDHRNYHHLFLSLD